MVNWRQHIIQTGLKLTGETITGVEKEIHDIAQFSAEKRKEFQQDALQQLLNESYKKVPYYTNLFNELGIVENGVVDMAQFHKIPVLTKDILRKHGEQMHATNHEERGSYENSSGGSTGEPVKFIQDSEYDTWNTSTKLFFNRRLGKNPGEPEIKLWGSDRDIIQGNLTAKDRLINFFYNRKFYNCYRFSNEEIHALVELHNSFKPSTYWAYVEAMHEFALYVKKYNIKVHTPKHIVTSIGPLYDDVRETIEDVFGCKVYNQYGSREVGVGAIDSNEHKDMDVFFWRLLFEIVPSEETDTNEGKVLVTALNNYSMPLIRYDIGDVAIPSDQEDGSFEIGGVTSHMKIAGIIGRTLGFFRKRDGSLIHSHYVVQQMFFRNWLKQFQFVQDEYEKIRCRIVTRPGVTPPPEEIKDIEDKIHILTGDDMVIEFEFPEKIERSSSGKYVYTVCNVK